MNTLAESPVKLSENAIKEIKRLMAASEDPSGSFLRLGVKGGGCSGLSYIIGFDKKEDDDMVYDVAGIPVIVKLSHALYLSGMEVRFEDGLNARGFSFNNPNASSSCGCGSSFAV